MRHFSRNDVCVIPIGVYYLPFFQNKNHESEDFFSTSPYYSTIFAPNSTILIKFRDYDRFLHISVLLATFSFFLFTARISTSSKIIEDPFFRRTERRFSRPQTHPFLAHWCKLTTFPAFTLHSKVAYPWTIKNYMATWFVAIPTGWISPTYPGQWVNLNLRQIF